MLEGVTDMAESLSDATQDCGSKASAEGVKYGAKIAAAIIASASASSDKSTTTKDGSSNNSEDQIESALAAASGHVSVEKSWNGGLPSDDVNEWTASLFDSLSVNRLSVFDRGNLIIPVWRLVEHAWLDLGLLDKTQLIPLQKALSNPTTKIAAQQDFVKFSKALGLRRIDGVSDETDADGDVTNTVEYFRQPEEELGNPTTDIKPDVIDLPPEMVRVSPCPLVFMPRVAPDVCPRTIIPAAGGARQALEAALGAN